MTPPTRVLSERYEVRGLIGRGGMADVHAGFDTRLGREVAIKILRSELARDPSFLLRFRREAQSAAGLSHPSIVAVFDSGEEVYLDGVGQETVQPFIVMEYVHGTTLRDRLSKDGHLPPDEACAIMAQVLRALEYSHRHGIVHRDIKPGNVMVTPTGVAKVMDFGIARAVADSAATMTNTSVVIGTAQYLSPEQAQGREVDARSDIYAAGCLLYELLTGRTPFVGESPLSVAYQHVGEPPQPPSVWNADVPQNLDVVILRALAKDPEARYQSAADFADDLEAVQRGERTQAESAAVTAGALGPAALADDDTQTHSVVAAPGDDKKRKRRRWLVPLVIGLVTLAGVLGLLAANGAFEGGSVTVPQVVQQRDEVAQQMLTSAGLTPERQAAENSAPAGTVVAQNPAPGTGVRAGTTVVYTVSNGPATITMPELRNFDQATARTMLEENGLSIGSIVPVDSKEVGAGNVVSTDPAAGEDVRADAVVTLNISTGRVTVPQVVGLDRDTAISRLMDAGLGRVFTPTPSDRAPGTILSQSYQEGEKVPVGTVVELAVASEPVPAETETQTETVTIAPAPPETTTDTGDTGDPGDGTGDPGEGDATDVGATADEEGEESSPDQPTPDGEESAPEPTDDSATPESTPESSPEATGEQN